MLLCAGAYELIQSHSSASSLFAAFAHDSQLHTTTYSKAFQFTLQMVVAQHLVLSGGGAVIQPLQMFGDQQTTTKQAAAEKEKEEAAPKEAESSNSNKKKKSQQKNSKEQTIATKSDSKSEDSKQQKSTEEDGQCKRMLFSSFRSLFLTLLCLSFFLSFL